jgi:hypothetical protein
LRHIEKAVIGDGVFGAESIGLFVPSIARRAQPCVSQVWDFVLRKQFARWQDFAPDAPCA